MSDTCETVRVKSEHPEHTDGFVVINKTDFDPAKHALHGDSAPAAIMPPPPPPV